MTDPVPSTPDLSLDAYKGSNKPSRAFRSGREAARRYVADHGPLTIDVVETVNAALRGTGVGPRGCPDTSRIEALSRTDR